MFNREGVEKNGEPREEYRAQPGVAMPRARSRLGDARNANREIGVPAGPGCAELFLGFVVLGVIWELDGFAGPGAVGGGAEILDWPAYWEA
jgi:hypothetical protein